MSVDPVAVALLVARTFERLGIPYVIGGSIASSIHGEPRTTADVDFAVRLDGAGADGLLRALEGEFYVNESGLREAATGGGHFNAIHLSSMVKVDVYVRPNEGLYAAEIERAQDIPLGDASARVASPEDTLLHKLRWFAAGGGASQRQWRDVLGILKSTGPALDRAYLAKWAEEIGVSGLLARAWTEAGLER